MRILAVESSAVSASAAILEENKLISEGFVNNGLTHSQTLMPIIAHVLNIAKMPLGSIDAFAVASGPGSFTGIRIGVASVKGIAFAENKPCLSISTLEAIAESMNFEKGIICAVMDARCNQVYNALFRSDGQKVRRLTDDRPISIEGLKEELKAFSEPVWLTGDGADICYALMGGESRMINISPLHIRFQRASGVAMVAARLYKNNQLISAEQLCPAYLRMPQAERELKKRQGEVV